jgi:hypothetical protein
MAPKDDNAMLLQRVEDSSLCKFRRLTNAPTIVRQGGLSSKNSIDDQSRNVHENTEKMDKLSN